MPYLLVSIAARPFPSPLSPPAAVSLERLGDFLADAFFVSVFVALMTIAALHLLRPAMRKTAQAITLLANAPLPTDLLKRGLRTRERQAPAAEEWPEHAEIEKQRVLKALIGLYARTPHWLGDSIKSWDRAMRYNWLRRIDDNDKADADGDNYNPQSAPLPIFVWRRRGFRARSTYLPDELFMRTIENEAKSVVGRPSKNPYLFTLLTATAPDEDRAMAAWFDVLAQREPAVAAKMMNAAEGAETGTAAAVAAAQSAVAAAAEAWLDRFQLSLASKSLLVNRLFAILAGIALAGLAAGVSQWRGPASLLTAVGIAGGLLGLLVHDAALGWAGGRRR